MSRLTFHQLRGSSVARSRLWKASLARGRRWMAGLAGAPGGLYETWRSSAGPGARPPAAVRTQRPPRLHVRGKTRESRCGCPEEGTCQLCANLGSPGRDPFYMCWTFVLHRVLPTRVPTQSCGAARRSPRSPNPARATHNVDSLFFSSLIPTTHFHRGNPERPAVLPVVPGDITSDPRRRPQHPKLKEKRVSPPALVGGCPEVPNFSPNRGR